ncbi:MAG: hypothetical protein TR69_WS6001000192 [candidate division WS6 bacterium OLB20]|uniref:Gram-positive cocci surface proteins LPxTG domain-containing protein n=1 Tax=candidate division WS6 bacterium OLB20 TaxID=1617426 RepID=A0A136M0A5_9BACT|nr:MAG: hypothetical protein TR69_WS6001000192 [candidate division WS6 bacterium OLB20]
MKTIDRIFVVMLIVLPFAVALVLVFQLLRNPNIAPDDTDALPTPTFAVGPVTVSPTATPTFDYEPVTPTVTATYAIPEDTDPATPTTRPQHTVTVTATPVATTAGRSPTPTSVSTATPAPTASATLIAELPDTQSSDQTLLQVLAVSLTVACVAGGLLTAGKILRGRTL